MTYPGSVVVNLIALRVHRNMKLGSPGLVPTRNSLRNQTTFSIGPGMVFAQNLDISLGGLEGGVVVASLNTRNIDA